MPSNVVKIAISLPKEAFQALEKTCEKLGIARSKLITEAVRDWISEHESSEAIQRYIQSYQDQPEQEDEIELIQSAAHHTLSNTEWENDEAG